MTPEEIRMAASNIANLSPSIESQPGVLPGTGVAIQTLMEISAQLAELNRNIREIIERWDEKGG